MDLYEVRIEYNDYSGEKRKKKKRSYIVEAYNLTDVDAMMTEILGRESLDDLVISSAKIITVNEVCQHPDSYYKTDTYWYKCLLEISGLDDEKKTKNVMMVRATSLANAVSELKSFMSDTVADWESVGVQATNVFDIVRK